MNNTVKLLLTINKVKKAKTSYINWKTFNAKQTGIYMPKTINILKKINKTLLSAIQKQIKMQQNLIMVATQKNNIKSKINSTTNENIKQIKYNSIFNVQNKKHIALQNTVYTTEQKKYNIGTQYAIYILLLNIYINIKNTATTTVTLPKKRTAYTVLKSPHADKKAREQYMKELVNVRISMQHYISIMKYMNSIVLSYTKAFIHSYKYNAFYENKI